MLLSQARSFFGVFGWMNVPAPAWLLVGAASVFVVGVLGALVLLPRRRDDALATQLGFVAAAELTMLGLALDCNESCWQGRYLFSVAAPLAVLAAAGLVTWLPRPAIALVPLAAVVALWVPFGVIGPAYQSVPLPKSAMAAIEHPLDLQVGPAFHLDGYAVRSEGPSRTLVATLYWRSRAEADFDYSAFVHLLDEHGRIVAQQDKPPGENRGLTRRACGVRRMWSARSTCCRCRPRPATARSGCASVCTTGRPAQLPFVVGARDGHGFVMTETLVLPPMVPSG